MLPGLARTLSPVLPEINPAPTRPARRSRRSCSTPRSSACSGKYFPSHARWREAPSSDASYDPERARELWEASVA